MPKLELGPVSGCGEQGSITELVAKLEGISNSEAYNILKENGYIENTSTAPATYTLEDFAREKHFDVEWLKRLGLQTAPNNKSVAIGYFDEKMEFVRDRFRNNPSSEPRFFWDRNGNGSMLYRIVDAKGL